jgi:hypothetical protein
MILQQNYVFQIEEVTKNETHAKKGNSNLDILYAVGPRVSTNVLLALYSQKDDGCSTSESSSPPIDILTRDMKTKKSNCVFDCLWQAREG